MSVRLQTDFMQGVGFILEPQSGIVLAFDLSGSYQGLSKRQACAVRPRPVIALHAGGSEIKKADLGVCQEGGAP
jgi:hypothetical protein